MSSDVVSNLLTLVSLLLARLLLKKQIQQLEILIQNKERKKSECLVSTPSHNIQYETPQTTNHVVVYTQTDSPDKSCGGLCPATEGRYVTDNWNMPRDYLVSKERYDISSGSIEREQSVSEVIDVTDTESSNDKKWTSRDFPWTKNLEVIGYLSSAVLLFTSLLCTHVLHCND